MRPWEVARLTDHQIIHDYILPQTARNELLERERKGLGPKADELEDLEGVSDEPPNRQMMISVMVGMLGMTLEAANADYDKQLAEHNARKRSR